MVSISSSTLTNAKDIHLPTFGSGTNITKLSHFPQFTAWQTFHFKRDSYQNDPHEHMEKCSYFPGGWSSYARA